MFGLIDMLLCAWMTDKCLMADRTRLELATSGVTGRHSNRLNYRSTLRHFKTIARASSKRFSRHARCLNGGWYWVRTSDPQLVRLVLSQLS